MRLAMPMDRSGSCIFRMQGPGGHCILLHQAIMSSGQFDNVFAPLMAQGYPADRHRHARFRHVGPADQSAHDR